MDGIKDKVVVITGASSGIGEDTAMLLAARGAKVVLGARTLERLERLADRIGESGGAVAFAATDVRRRADVSALVQLAIDRFGRIDVLFSNAGTGPIAPLDALDVDDWDATIDVNIKGVLHGIAAALPVFRAQGSGHFVHTASTAAHRIVPNMAVYAATKTAVRAISEGLRQEAGDRLRVTVISPGFTRTNFADSINDPAVRDSISTAMERMAMPASAVARAVAYAIDQPDDVEIGEIVVRPTAQN